MKKIRVFTTSWGQLHGRHSNMGDIIIFEAVLDILKSLKPVETIYCYSSDPSYTNSQYSVKSVNPFNLRGLLATIRNLHRSDIILLGGGELVQTKSSFMYLAANLAPGLMSWIFQKRCLAIGVGIADEGEISKIGKIISRFILNRTDRICVREHASFRNALSIGIKREKLRLTADLAFHFAERKFPTTLSATGRTLLLSPRYTKKRKGCLLPSWIKRKIGREAFDQDFHESAIWFAGLLNQLCKNFNVIMLPVYQNPDTSSQDLIFVRKIIEVAGLPDVEIYEGPMTVNAILRLMEKIDFAIGVPLHSIVMAAINRKPMISLSYASKCKNFMDELKLEDNVFAENIQKNILDIDSVNNAIQNCINHSEEFKGRIKKTVISLLHRHRKTIHTIKSSVLELYFTRQ